MHDYILRKYAGNIRILSNKVSILPKDYKNKKHKSTRWKVFFWYHQEGISKRLQYTKAKIIINKMPIQVNRIEDHSLKIEYIELIKEAVINELNNDPRFITSLIYGKDKAKELYPDIFGIVKEETEPVISIEKALAEALKEKKGKVGDVFYNGLRTAKDRFLRYIGKAKGEDVSTLNTKMIADFLSSKKASNTTYNNEKARLSTLLTELKRWEYIPINYADNIKKLKTSAKKNTAFPNELRLKIVEELKQTPILYYYYLHIYYGLMRPKTIIRLQVKDIDLKRRIFDTDTKTGNFVKLINEVLFEEVYSKLDLDNANPDDYIFNIQELLGSWETTERNKVGYYSKKFSKIKKKYNLSSDYTWYSFRHSAIGNIFENKVIELKEKGELNYIEKSIEFVRQFTNHTTNRQTKQYLRGISVELHVDWSGYL